jgi:hypothetical protein
MRIEYVTDIEIFRAVGEDWLSVHRGKNYGFTVTVDGIIADTKSWLALYDGAVIGLFNDLGQPVGFMSIFCVPDFMGGKPIAFEKYWYVLPNYRAGALLQLNEAKHWAKEKGASHLILGASAMASSMHEHLCALYEKMGMALFETSYIVEL